MLRYSDPGAAIELLTKAFGFAEQQVDRAPDGTIVHAELSFGNGMVMLGSASSARTGSGPVDTAYVVVDDPDAHHDQAKAAGAEISMDLVDQHYGSREYAAKDPRATPGTSGRTARSLSPDQESAESEEAAGSSAGGGR